MNVPSNYTNVETPMLILYHGYSNTAVGFNRTSGATIVRGAEMSDWPWRRGTAG